jgi:cytochrome P450
MQPHHAPGLPDGLDLFGPQFQANPAAIYEQLRHSGAVHYLPRHGWYLVTKAEAGREVLRDAERFSSRVHKHTQPPAEVADEVAQIRAQGCSSSWPSGWASTRASAARWPAWKA